MALMSEMSNGLWGLVSPASLARFPLKNWKSTRPPVRLSTGALLLARAGARKVVCGHAGHAGCPFWLISSVHWNTPPMFVTLSVPSASTFGRCGDSLQMPTNDLVEKNLSPVEMG